MITPDSHLIRTVVSSADMTVQAEEIDLAELGRMLEANPGPQIYVELLKAQIAYVMEVRRIGAELGHQRRFPEATWLMSQLR